MKHYIALFLAVSTLLLVGCSVKTPEGLGMRDGRFAACAQGSNCVSSQATDEHHIAPIAARGGLDVVMVDLANAIESMFGSTVVVMDGPYLRAEFTSGVMRFVEDMECYYDQGRGVIEVRCASRVGRIDVHASRNRVEELRKVFTIRRSS
ncbi:DUF1499 domain-containing protein [Pseudodesulfovibrio pelocollis]|uniref:DUF1499 domain-containing protein n=1 Tax=Pseudodesulfovibrio pelocollis TaxID=3051432 RepID=UPI00255AE86F|nr:DUF1499 domain-containing protein [Pseudodesulfovibrio sp. SB368]